LYFFQQARRSKDVKNEADINFLALTAQNKVAFPADSLLQILGSDKPGAKANALALANAQHKSLDVNFTLSTDTALNVYQAVLISNELINKKDNIDSAIISSIEKLARRPVNLNFREALLAAACQAWYAQGQVRRASETIRELAYNTNNGKYFQLLGLWLLEQNNPATAANYFKIGIEKETPMAAFYKAIAETQQGNLAEASAEWSTLPKEGEAGTLTTRTLKIINSTPTEIAALSDPDKYAYSRYKINLTDTALFNTVVNSIQAPQWKARAVYDRAAQWFEQDEPDRAIAYLSALKGITFQDNNLYNDIMRLSALIAAARQNWQGLESQLDKIPFNSFHRTEKIYLEALLDEAKGKDAEAKTKYQYLSQANLQFEDALVASSRYLASDTTDRLKAYSILVNGLLAKPNSIKLLKAYVKYAAFLGFDDEAQRSLDLLRTLLPPPSFNKYVRQNPDFFSTESNGQK
jgi:hypothetical protein